MSERETSAVYPEAVNLPFNATVLGKDFIPHPPGSPEPAGSGWWVLLRRGALIVRQEAERYVLPEGGLPPWALGPEEPVTVGMWRGRPLRVASLAPETELPEPFCAEPFNAVEERLDDLLLTLGGLGAQVLHWERQSCYCPRCGGEVERLPGSWGKHCPTCRTDRYPAIHPCAIVLVRRGDEFLLIRKAEWAPGRYSLVAGFLDFGESLEECAVREVREETGVGISAPCYVGSQNWPFPSQLMAGFVADYTGGEVCPDPAEVEDARWFRADQLPVAFPPRRSIARWIIDRYALGLR